MRGSRLNLYTIIHVYRAVIHSIINSSVRIDWRKCRHRPLTPNMADDFNRSKKSSPFNRSASRESIGRNWLFGVLMLRINIFDDFVERSTKFTPEIPYLHNYNSDILRGVISRRYTVSSKRRILLLWLNSATACEWSRDGALLRPPYPTPRRSLIDMPEIWHPFKSRRTPCHDHDPYVIDIVYVYALNKETKRRFLNFYSLPQGLWESMIEGI